MGAAHKAFEEKVVVVSHRGIVENMGSLSGLGVCFHEGEGVPVCIFGIYYARLG